LSIGYLQRKAAWEILLKVSSGDFSDHALEKVLKNYQFNPLDIAFITELSFGCISIENFLIFGPIIHQKLLIKSSLQS